MNCRLGLASLELSTEYRTGEHDPVEGFYRPCLLNANEYKRAVGYFRSSVYLVIGAATVEFARRGGKIRLICSPSITEEDLSSIALGYEARMNRAAQRIDEEIDGLLSSENTAYRTRVLATLIAVGALDIRLAIKPEAMGLYHEKLGIFSDTTGNRVSFLGSANETWSGWHQRGNHESIEVFCEWKMGSEADRVRRHDAYFEKLWNGGVAGIEVVDFPEASKLRLTELSLGRIEDVDTTELIENPSKRIALEHQSSAIAAWKAAGRRGIFEHATGSGKTFTALLAIREHTMKGNPALILVPSTLLLEQWAKEVRQEIPEAALLLAGSGNVRWREPGRLQSLSDPSTSYGPRVILSTMQTAATEGFTRGLQAGPHLMIVADEVHQVGSEFNSRVLTLESGPRLGLSATPRRYGDPEGTERLLRYFGPVIDPKITLQDAIRAGRLVEYEYFPHPIHLTAEEAESWKTLTRRISLELARQREGDSGRRPLTERAKMLLIQRSRIAKKAAGKVRLAVDTLTKHYQSGQRWLVYCEDAGQLSDVLHALRAAGLSPVEYHTGMTGDRAATLAWFRSFGGILVSIRCLDEGVDIPSIDHALILASSQNPRQFIQRRGRVLRTSANKLKAVIHDAIVIPVSTGEEPDQISLLKSETIRALEFADSSLNRSASAEIRRIALQMGLDPASLEESGMEEDE